jgi:hypothetical protein
MLWVRKIHSNPACFEIFWYFLLLIEEFLYPLAFVVINNRTKARALSTLFGTISQELDSFYDRTGTVFKYSLIFSGIKLILTLILFQERSLK